jgi:hypothetical protein
MSPKRILLSFAITFACALAVFTLPRFVWNTVGSAVAQNRPGIGDSGLGTGARQGAPPAPNAATPSSPIPNPQSPVPPAASPSLYVRLQGFLRTPTPLVPCLRWW